MNVGDTIRVPEKDYAFGSGTLTMKVEEVVSTASAGGERWAELRGRDVRPDGSLAPTQRYASVRVSAITVVSG
ncbi:hypothetical protein KBX37_10095 [Micromonospora sp. U56]|uniref:hypothetical protein n=1 Tax=Micromonospora sp. U56 TaxID=2824900 RepID=UPI001B35C233|nr:hypothetical protein [Micromonospora sp. U56]MBQ0893441.1 hypothetical protein [Micromonospora sp. U56]